MHMDPKLRVLLKGILVTEEDGLKILGVLFIYLIFSKIICSLFACHQTIIGYPAYIL